MKNIFASISMTVLMLQLQPFIAAEEEEQDIILTGVVGLSAVCPMTDKGKPSGKIDLTFEQNVVRSTWLAGKGFKELTYTAKRTEETQRAPWQFDVDATNDKGVKLMLRGQFAADETIALTGTVSFIKADGAVSILQYAGTATQKGDGTAGKGKEPAKPQGGKAKEKAGEKDQEKGEEKGEEKEEKDKEEKEDD